MLITYINAPFRTRHLAGEEMYTKQHLTTPKHPALDRITYLKQPDQNLLLAKLLPLGTAVLHHALQSTMDIITACIHDLPLSLLHTYMTGYKY